MLTGDFSRLARVTEALRELSEVLPRAEETIASGMQEELAHEFATGTDPYGTLWAPLRPATVAKGRSAPPLTASGRMAASAQARAERDGVAVTIDPPAQYLEAKRPMLPDHGPPAQLEQLVRGAVEHEVEAVRRRA
jgi:Phage virion morphogenesis family